jgi:hypothetical protein
MKVLLFIAAMMMIPLLVRSFWIGSKAESKARLDADPLDSGGNGDP